jgi:hypothetical protein
MLYELPVSLPEMFHEVKGSELSTQPLFRVDPINQTAPKNNVKLNPIAQNFMRVVVLAPTLYQLRSFSHYVSLYALHRPKDFFLLI